LEIGFINCQIITFFEKISWNNFYWKLYMYVSICLIHDFNILFG